MKTTVQEIESFEKWRESFAVITCPKCDRTIIKDFYCLNCGFVPAWREAAAPQHDTEETTRCTSDQ
jgi:hypothetical protein